MRGIEKAAGPEGPGGLVSTMWGGGSYSASFWSILSLAKGRLMPFTLMTT